MLTTAPAHFLKLIPRKEEEEAEGGEERRGEERGREKKQTK